MSRNPYVGWWSGVPPTVVGLSVYTWVGAVFQFNVPGRVFGLRAYLIAASPFPRTAVLWKFSSNQLQGNLVWHQLSPSATGWMSAYFKRATHVATGDWWDAAALLNGGYARQANGANGIPIHNNIGMVHGWQSTSISPIDASITNNANANGIDVIFLPD